ncbi:carbonic anhydrase [Kyrpidia spormannii]|uniref:carbonic anhydrase n=1 Tax=Kyrpidia spormannii TaxID=2055160 RepID=A0A2K8N707_9BACL|nr:carbonic anhydrase [Kyrpidia spormannii]ATY85118.1 carbonic anhydrase [Kyrpidia spormannii]
MSFLAETLAFNREFVQNRSYAEIPQSKYPKKKVLVVTCMDARLVELLPRAMNLHNGDAKFVKTAGALISHPFGGAMRSIMVGVYQLGVEEILVIGHHDCGMIGLRPKLVLERAQTRGIPPERLDTLKGAGIDLEGWLTGFDRVEEAVAHSVEMIRQHPLIPRDLPVHGLVVDPTTGQLEVLIDGYNMSRSRGAP